MGIDRQLCDKKRDRTKAKRRSQNRCQRERRSEAADPQRPKPAGTKCGVRLAPTEGNEFRQCAAPKQYRDRAAIWQEVMRK